VATPLANFHMAGHFTVWPGAVPTAALSGKIAALRADDRLRARRRLPAARERTSSENVTTGSTSGAAPGGR
jgi:hypothetical protein